MFFGFAGAIATLAYLSIEWLLLWITFNFYGLLVIFVLLYLQKGVFAAVRWAARRLP